MLVDRPWDLRDPLATWRVPKAGPVVPPPQTRKEKLKSEAATLSASAESIVDHFKKIGIMYGYIYDGEVVFRRTALPRIMDSLNTLIGIDFTAVESGGENEAATVGNRANQGTVRMLANLELSAARKHAVAGNGNENSTYIYAGILKDLTEGIHRKVDPKRRSFAKRFGVDMARALDAMHAAVTKAGSRGAVESRHVPEDEEDALSSCANASEGGDGGEGSPGQQDPGGGGGGMGAAAAGELQRLRE
jgi:hypothetical protein